LTLTLVTFPDFLTDTPEVVRENILCELESISEHFGIDQYRQRKTKTQLAEIDEEEGESAMAAKMAEIEGALAELQKLMEEENS